MQANEREAPRRKRIRRYQSVTDRVSRRIYKLDRWRVPWPGGLAAISLGYAAGLVFAVAVVSSLPLVGAILELLPWSATWIAVPLVGSWALTSLRIDGRAPHHVAVAACRWALRPRSLAGLRPCPEKGSTITPLAELVVAPSGDESAYRCGRVSGPALLTLRYPAAVSVDYSRRARVRRAVELLAGGRRRAAWSERAHRLARADRLHVAPIAGGERALRVGADLRVPAGREVRFP